MQPLSLRVLLFWTLSIALISSLSTIIFSETLLNDSLGGILLAVSLLGLLCYGTFRLVDQIFDICNP